MVRSDYYPVSCTHFFLWPAVSEHSFFLWSRQSREALLHVFFYLLYGYAGYLMVKWLSDTCWKVYFRYSLTTDIPFSPSAHSSSLAIVSGLKESLLHFWQKPLVSVCAAKYFPSLCLIYFPHCLWNIFLWIGICTFKWIILLIIFFMARFGVCLFVCFCVLSLLNEIHLLPSVFSSFSLPLLQRRVGLAGTWRLLVQPCFNSVNHA